MVRRECSVGSDHTSDATIAGLVRVYADAALRHGRATEDGDPETANEAHDLLVSCHSQLRLTGRTEALDSLIGDARPWVRLWAARHLLDVVPEPAEQALRELAALPGLIGFTASMTYREWKGGRLSFD